MANARRGRFPPLTSDVDDIKKNNHDRGSRKQIVFRKAIRKLKLQNISHQ